MSILNNNLLLGAPAGSSQYTVSRSLRFNAADSAFLSRAFGSAGNRRTATLSFWLKKSNFSADQTLFSCGSTGGEANEFEVYFGGNGADISIRQKTSNTFSCGTTAVFRDPSAWYHIVISVDTTQVTAANRLKLYVNNVEQVLSGTLPTQNTDLGLGSATTWNLGRRADAVQYINGYLAEVHYVDGSALAPSSFGETDTNGEWQPKAYTGSYGTNGFRLTFSDNSGTTATTLGKDAAGSNNFTPNNFSVATGAGNDSLVDTPTSYGTGNSGGDVRGNYATLNPLDLAGGTAFSLANGNLEATFTNGGQTAIIVSTIFVSSGKWYAEFTPTTLGANSGTRIGVQKNVLPRTYLGGDAGNYAYQLNGNKQNNASSVAYGSSYTTNDVVGVALDMDAGTVTYYKNGVSQGQAYSGLSGEYTFAYTDFGNGAFVANFGQRPFAYTAPSGFKALCDTSLPTPTIIKPSTVFDTKLYTGNGSSQTVTGLGFSPDFVWLKSRSQAVGHFLFDQIRGAGKFLSTDSTTSESDFISTLSGFTSDGFSVGNNAGVNNNTSSYVGWAWDAGSSNATNNAGSITSTVRANASAGFSIISFTGNETVGATLGHGLGAKPGFAIFKDRNSGTRNFIVYHQSLGAGKFLKLNSTDAAATSSIMFNNTEPSSTVFSLANNSETNSTNSMICWAWTPVAGYSSMGSYVGTGSATSSPFVYCGFRPRWLLVKRSDTTDTYGHWHIIDAARNTYNAANNKLAANLSVAENDTNTLGGGDANQFDFLANGFRPSSNYAGTNASNGTYIYFAVAESPLQYARAR